VEKIKFNKRDFTVIREMRVGGFEDISVKHAIA
jgi:hypothetical protein